MRALYFIIGCLLIFLGCTLMNTTVFDEQMKTLALKIIGFFVMVVGVFEIRKAKKMGS